MSIDKAQIEVPEEHGGPGIATAAYRVLESFDGAADEEKREKIRHQTKHALHAFPELAGQTITIGRLDPDEDDAAGRADFYNFMTLYHPDRWTSWQTVYHELAHLAIHVRRTRDEDVPITSEEYCSIFTVSRMPARHLQRDDISYLGEPGVPKDEWPDICQRALDYREENGANSHYIQRAREWLEI